MHTSFCLTYNLFISVNFTLWNLSFITFTWYYDDFVYHQITEMIMKIDQPVFYGRKPISAFALLIWMLYND